MDQAPNDPQTYAPVTWLKKRSSGSGHSDSAGARAGKLSAESGMGRQVIMYMPNLVPGHCCGLNVCFPPLLPPNSYVKILPPRSDGMSN